VTRYVHITDECRTEAQGLGLGLESRLSKIKEQIEAAQNLSGFDFLSATVLKKRSAGPSDSSRDCMPLPVTNS